MSLHTSDNSFSTFSRYTLILATWDSFPLDSSFCSIEEMILHDARRAPITLEPVSARTRPGRPYFLYDTESRLRSSTVSSTPSWGRVSARTRRRGGTDLGDVLHAARVSSACAGGRLTR